MRLDERAVKFLQKSHLSSVAVTDEEGAPYAFNAFYAFNGDDLNPAIIFASDENSAHARAFSRSDAVSGTVALDTKIIGKIKGAQFSGKVSLASKAEREIYFARFPYARAVKGEIYKIVLERVKFTSNTLGFGKKILWSKGE